MRVSLMLQTLAQNIDDVLTEIAGERVNFVLVVQADKIAQYVSNASRQDGTELLEGLLARWKAGRADIPAHYNPDLMSEARRADAAEWHDMRELNREMRADALRLRWLAEDHADPEVRERVRSICQSIPTRSLSGVRLDIDANMRA